MYLAVKTNKIENLQPSACHYVLTFKVCVGLRYGLPSEEPIPSHHVVYRLPEKWQSQNSNAVRDTVSSLLCYLLPIKKAFAFCRKLLN